MADEEILEEGEEVSAQENPVARFLSKALGYIISILFSIILSVSIMFLVFRGQISQERNEEVLTVQLQPKPAPLSYYDLGEFRINTADIDANFFIRINISLGYDAENRLLYTELVSRHVQIRDIVLNLLHTKQKNQMDEYLEKEQLKEELRRTINNVLINQEIDAVYFTEFLIS